MINFCLLGWDEKNLNWITFAIKELAYRMGFEFKISFNEDKNDNSEFTVIYAAYPYTKDLTHGLILTALTSSNHYAPLEIEKNKKIWTAQNDNDFDIIKGSHFLLSLESEKGLSDDCYDNFQRIIQDIHPMKDYILEPFLEFNANYLKELIIKHGYTGKVNKFFNDYDLTVIMTHDVDGPSLINKFALFRSAFLGFIKNNKLERESFYFGVLSKIFKEEDPYWNFKYWVELEKELGLKATYFFYPGKIKNAIHIKDPKYKFSNNIQKEIENLEVNRMEIGLHSGININTTELYLGSKKLIEKYTKSPILGHRAHYWAIDWKNPFESWHTLSKAGFKYDMSMSPMGIGYRNSTMYPVNTSKDKNKTFFVLATAIMDGYCVDDKNIKIKIGKIIEDVVNNNGILVLDWHIRTLFNAGAFSKYLDSFFFIINELKKYNVNYCTGNEVIEQWDHHIHKLYKGNTNE